MVESEEVKKFELLSKGDYAFLGILITFLVIVSRYNYILFHSLVEIAITSIGILAFTFTWHLRRFELGYLLNIGILLGATALINIFHMLSFKDMGVFNDQGNLATQFWIAQRYFFSVFLLTATMFPKSRMKPTAALFTLLTSGILMIVIVLRNLFPECYIPSQGQTSFKIISEYIICGILFLTMCLFWKDRKKFSPHVSKLILFFYIFSILTDLIFTSYLSIVDVSNMSGHIAQLIASYFLYKAVVERGLRNPFESLFRDLKEAVRIRDEFISLASHELKTPLTPLKLQLQMIQREMTIDDPQMQKLLKVNKQVDRLNQLIDGMLDISRLNSGRFQIYPEKLQLQHFITEIVNRYTPQFEATQSTIKLNLPPIEADIDPLRFEQVLTNLLMNIIRYAPRASVNIELKKLDLAHFQLIVSDDGPGIPEEFHDRIFERYERGKSENSTAGLGLGLYISRQIVESHKGSIKLDQHFKGAKFVIELPIQQ